MDILLYTLKAVAYAITEPYLVIFLVLMAFILYRQNKKTTVMQKMILGESINSPFELTISQIVIGIFAGCAASLLLSYLGVVFGENSSIDLIFLFSIIFMFLSPRLICFSYSGTAIGMLSLILAALSKTMDAPWLNFLQVDIPSLMTLVAVLHFIEGILVMADGSRGSIPVFTNRDEKIIGGFAFNRYWALPIALFIMISSKQSAEIGGTVSMPQWWPILRGLTPGDVLKNALITLIPFYGVLGFSTVTFTKSKREKTLSSGLSIIAYSIVLFGLAQLSAVNLLFKIVVLAFAVTAHEGMLRYQSKMEFKGKPKFISDEEGIMLLDVAPGSPADEMGLASGDKLLTINGHDIDREEDIAEHLKVYTTFVEMTVKGSDGSVREVSYNKMSINKRLGIVFVPRGVPKDSMVVKLEEKKFKDIFEKIKKDNNDDNRDE